MLTTAAGLNPACNRLPPPAAKPEKGAPDRNSRASPGTSLAAGTHVLTEKGGMR